MLDFEDLMSDYAEFITYIVLKDYNKAAQILCDNVIIYCKHPQRFESYQTPSISFLIRQLGDEWSMNDFIKFQGQLISLCEEGNLGDARIRGQ